MEKRRRTKATTQQSNTRERRCCWWPGTAPSRWPAAQWQGRLSSCGRNGRKGSRTGRRNGRRNGRGGGGRERSLPTNSWHLGDLGRPDPRLGAMTGARSDGKGLHGKWRSSCKLQTTPSQLRVWVTSHFPFGSQRVPWLPTEEMTFLGIQRKIGIVKPGWDCLSRTVPHTFSHNAGALKGPPKAHGMKQTNKCKATGLKAFCNPNRFFGGKSKGLNMGGFPN